MNNEGNDKDREVCREEGLELIEAQILLEKLGSEMGTRRMLRSLDNMTAAEQGADTKLGTIIVNRLIENVIRVMQANYDDEINNSRKKKLEKYKHLLEGHIASIASIAIRHVISAAMGETIWNSVNLRIGNEISMEHKLKLIRAMDAQLLGRLQRFMDQHHSMQRKQKILTDFISNKRLAAQVDEQAHEKLGKADKTYLGMWAVFCCIEGMRDARGYFVELQHDFVNRNRKTLIRFAFSERASTRLEEIRDQIAELAQVVFPMIVKPVPLTEDNLTTYGYLSSFAPRVKFVKTSNKEHKRALESASFPTVIHALNAAMNTPWKINKTLLALIKDFGETNMELGGLPRSTLEQHDVLKPAYAAKDDNPEALQRYKVARLAASNNDRKLISRRATYYLKIMIAEKMAAVKCFYNVWELDKRGRGYPLSILNCQGDDITRSLLQFAQGKALGETGYFWLCLHLANLMKEDPLSKRNIDKLSLKERVFWVESHQAVLLNMASHYTNPEHWKETGYIGQADKPFQFCAALLEWQDAYRSADREQFVSCLPVALDASCSGLQVYAALLRDKETAQRVNLMDNQRPEDIYTYIAVSVERMITLYLEKQGITTYTQAKAQQMKDVKEYCEKSDMKLCQKLDLIAARKSRPEDIIITEEKDKQLMKLWNTPVAIWGLAQMGIKRETVKNPVMTIFYASQLFGIGEQLKKKIFLKDYEKLSAELRINHDVYLNKLNLDERVARDLPFPFEGIGASAAMVLAGMISKAVEEVIRKPYEAMQWFISCAEHITRSGSFVCWTTPLGLPIVMNYKRKSRERIDCLILGKRRQTSVSQDNNEPDTGKAKNAIAPNIIHSLDSSLMWQTVSNAANAGMEQFSLIHDSFAVPAGDTEHFSMIIRQSFVQLFESDYMEQLECQFLSQMNSRERNEMEGRPVQGQFNLEHVLTAKHAFS